MNALSIEDLYKRYPTGTEALRGVSLEIEDGEFFGLLGPNGAGKSTLIHCTTGLAQPTSGSIEVFGHDAIDHYERGPRWPSGSRRRSSTSTGSSPLEETLDYHGGYFGMPQEGPQGARRGAARRLLAHREARRAHAHAVGRHEAPAGPRPRADAPARGC